jgi:hypothetical protein
MILPLFSLEILCFHIVFASVPSDIYKTEISRLLSTSGGRGRRDVCRDGRQPFLYWPKGRKTTKNREYEEIKRKTI